MTVVAGESVDVQLRVNTEVLLDSITCKEVTDGGPTCISILRFQTLHQIILKTYWQ